MSLVTIELTRKQAKQLVLLLDKEAELLNDAEDTVLGAWPLTVISQLISQALRAPVKPTNTGEPTNGVSQ